MIKLTKEQLIKDICNLYKSGLTSREIAEELGISNENVKSYMKRYIRLRKDYKYIKQIHDERKKRLKEVKYINKRIKEAALREIENKVKKYLNNENLIGMCRSAYKTTCDGKLIYIYDKRTKPSDLPRSYRLK